MSAACHISCLSAADLEKRLLEFGTYDSSLPKPGDLLLQDYRDHDKASQAWVAAARGRPVRVVQWNIERGYKFEEIVQTLKILDADVLLLQEIDVGCDRSSQRDVGVLSPARNHVPSPGRSEACNWMSPCMDMRAGLRGCSAAALQWAGVDSWMQRVGYEGCTVQGRSSRRSSACTTRFSASSSSCGRHNGTRRRRAAVFTATQSCRASPSPAPSASNIGTTLSTGTPTSTPSPSALPPLPDLLLPREPCELNLVS